MPATDRPQPVSRFPLAQLATVVTVSVFAFTGCTSGVSTSAPSGSPTATASPSPSPTSSTTSSGKTGFSKSTQAPSASPHTQSTPAASESSSREMRSDFEHIEFEGSFDDFVAATEQAPARNVPRPIEPQGMNEHTEEGFTKFVAYYLAERNYAITSGDTARWRKLVTPQGKPNKSQQAELAFLDAVDAAYANGGWVVNGHRRMATDSYGIEKISTKKGEYLLTGYLQENGTVVLNPAGNPHRMEWVPVTRDAYFYGVTANYENGAWVLGGQFVDYSRTIAAQGS